MKRLLACSLCAFAFQATAAAHVLDEYVQAAQIALRGVEFPSRREMNEGIGAIRLDLAAETDLRAAGEHQLSFRNDHLPELSVYLSNALVPATDAIKITGQQRDALQHGLRVDFLVLSPDARAWPRWIRVLLLGLCLVLLLTQWKRLNFRTAKEIRMP